MTLGWTLRLHGASLHQAQDQGKVYPKRVRRFGGVRVAANGSADTNSGAGAKTEEFPNNEGVVQAAMEARTSIFLPTFAP
jgi:hypothetical protein